jgi:hypothetical protein
MRDFNRELNDELIRMQEEIAAHRKRVADYFDLITKLDEADVRIVFPAYSSHLNLYFSGDKEKLEKIWGIIRSAGLHPSQRPDDKPQTEFSCYWSTKEDGARQTVLWMKFSSTVCKLKQVGSQTKEVPIYEVTCE